jgi:hypothetical protein
MADKQSIYLVNFSKQHTPSTLKQLRDEADKDKKKDKKDKKKKDKLKPFINEKNKILLPSRENITKNIRESNRTAILLNQEFMP